jgi:titin
MFAWFSRRLLNRRSSPTRRPGKRSSRTRLSIELLEDRLVPTSACGSNPFMVTTTADSGSCSLRQAILDADAHAGPAVIDFNIPGSGVHTITPLSPLPALTAAGTVLNGYTQPGASPNTLARGDNAVLLIELDGSAAGTGADGLDVTGGHCTVSGLVINRFRGNDIGLSAAGGDVVAGNFLGTDPTGSIGEGSGTGTNGTGYGVYVVSSSPSDLIGGTTPAARNLLSGNLAAEVRLDSAGNAVQGNYVGTDATGLAAVANPRGSGIAVTNSGQTIGGGTAGAGNVIAGNPGNPGSPGAGLEFYNSSINIATPAPSFVQGNLIGLGADGETPLGNVAYGIYVALDSRNVHVGGTTAADRNVISANGDGILIDAGATGLTVQGNYIGTDASGELARGNGYFGLVIDGTSGVLIGGTAPGAGNLISGQNPSTGGGAIGINGGTGDVIQGNYIGTDVTGSAALPNGLGIWINGTASGETVGGTTAAARNIISGNAHQGVVLDGLSGHGNGNVVEGNYIGTDATGTAALGNGTYGVWIDHGATGNVVGGATAAARNVISANGQDGVSLSDSGTSGNVVEGNYVGTDASGTQALGNAGAGVLVQAGASASIVNDLIADNHVGVDVSGGTALLQDSDLSNNTTGPGAAGLVAENGAVVDAGQDPGSPYGNLTGLGVSSGGNTFNGYTTAPVGGANDPTKVPQALRDLNTSAPSNTGPAYGNPGPQLGSLDLPAQHDTFGNLGGPVSSLQDIENLVYHDPDNPALGFVSYGTPTAPNPGPAASSLSQNAAAEGSGDLTVTVNGSNFTNLSTVLFNEVPLATTFLNAQQLQAVIPAALLADEGMANLTVADAQRGLSNAQAFAVTENVPTVSATVTQSRTLQNVTIKGQVFDQAPEGHRVRIDWGDGTVDVVDLGVGRGGAFAASHHYTRHGPRRRTVKVTALDDEGTASAVLTLSVRVHR